MKRKPFFHREKLSAVPATGFVEVYKESNKDSGEPEYMPLSLLLGVPVGATAPVIVAGTAQALSGAGAITTTQHKTNLTTGAGAAAWTMIDGTIIGQMKCLQMVVDGGGTGTLTPATFADGDTLAFADVGDTAELIWTADGWAVVDLYNRADGATAPVVA